VSCLEVISVTVAYENVRLERTQRNDADTVQVWIDDELIDTVYWADLVKIDPLLDKLRIAFGEKTALDR
jgi:hypothetical protein